VTVVDTPRGDARVSIDVPDGPPRSLLVLGHGAGGSVDAPDLSAVALAALAAGVMVAKVTQPYRVAGRRTPPTAIALDEAWATVVNTVRAGDDVADLPLVLGGRSSGARVACRTARVLGAVGVVALAFPLHPPGRPEVSRAEEIDLDVPTLIINGDRDPFGVPDRESVSAIGAPDSVIEVIVRPGDRHDLRKDPAAVGRAVVEWLRGHGWAA
jgi:predicted alpha/beta-hydrolase family hydrolase